MLTPNRQSVNDRAITRKSDAQRQQGLDAVKNKRARPTTKARIATLNVGTLTGKSREIAAMMTQRGIDILYAYRRQNGQEVKQEGKQETLAMGVSYTTQEGKNQKNGVAICLSNKWLENYVVTVTRTSDRIVSLKLLTRGKTYNIFSVYPPQQGCESEENDVFWNQLEEVIEGIPSTEELIVAGDMNGHVGRERGVFERWHGGKTVGGRNEEGERILRMAQTCDLALVNTFYTQTDQKLVTYKSGGNATVIDYITVRRTHLGWDV